MGGSSFCVIWYSSWHMSFLCTLFICAVFVGCYLWMQFKNLAQKVNEIDISGFFKSLEKVKPEPSEGSSFFRDCLVELRVWFHFVAFRALSKVIMFFFFFWVVSY